MINMNNEHGMKTGKIRIRRFQHGSKSILLRKNPVAVKQRLQNMGCQRQGIHRLQKRTYHNLRLCHPVTDQAIMEQLKNGIVFSQPHYLEAEVAELLCEVIPSAEKVRFLKTGGEACAACIKIARAYTGKDHIIQIGYNGWLNTVAAGARLNPRRTRCSERNSSSRKRAVPFGRLGRYGYRRKAVFRL